MDFDDSNSTGTPDDEETTNTPSNEEENAQIAPIPEDREPSEVLSENLESEGVDEASPDVAASEQQGLNTDSAQVVSDGLDEDTGVETEEPRSDSSSNASGDNQIEDEGTSANDPESSAHSKRLKSLAIGLGVGAGVIVAVLCLVFLWFIPAQQQAAFEEAKEAMSQYDFDTAIAKLGQAGDSEEVNNELARATQARDYSKLINDAFASGDGVTDKNKTQLESAIAYIKANYKDYPDIDNYDGYLDAYEKESSGKKSEAWGAYKDLGDFYDSKEKASSLEQEMESTYQEAEKALAEQRWSDAASLYANVSGYKDADEKGKTAGDERDMDQLAKDIQAGWVNRYNFGGWSGYDYQLGFQAAADSPNGRKGICLILMNAANVTGVHVGSYNYEVVGPHTIHLKGEYNTAGNPPTQTFDDDIQVSFPSSTRNNITGLKGNRVPGEGGVVKYMQLSPNPVSGQFLFSAWIFVMNVPPAS